jgi:hypothetical protein
MKHVGKMSSNGARVVVVYRTLPGDPLHALVVGTQGLTDMYHDGLMTIVESDSGQTANELAEILAVRKFADGSNMLAHLHSNGHLKKVPTSSVVMTPTTKDQIPLDKLNDVIAEQKGVALEELAVSEGNNQAKKVASKKASKDEVEETESVPTTSNLDLSPAEMRSRADALYKEAARLRKEADALDPPKKKAKETV